MIARSEKSCIRPKPDLGGGTSGAASSVLDDDASPYLQSADETVYPVGESRRYECHILVG